MLSARLPEDVNLDRACISIVGRCNGVRHRQIAREAAVQTKPMSHIDGERGGASAAPPSRPSNSTTFLSVTGRSGGKGRAPHGLGTAPGGATSCYLECSQAHIVASARAPGSQNRSISRRYISPSLAGAMACDIAKSLGRLQYRQNPCPISIAGAGERVHHLRLGPRTAPHL